MLSMHCKTESKQKIAVCQYEDAGGTEIQKLFDAAGLFGSSWPTMQKSPWFMMDFVSLIASLCLTFKSP